MELIATSEARRPVRPRRAADSLAEAERVALAAALTMHNGDLQRSEVFRSQDAVLTAGEAWKAAMIDKGWE